MQVNIHEAKSQLSKLIKAAQRGEDVIIARDGAPVARIVPVPPAGVTFRFGPIPELVGTQAPDFLEPMTEEDLRDWE